MVLTKDDFLRRWNSGPDGGGITNDDCADCYVAWGLGASPRTMPISNVVYRVVEAAETFCKDKEVVGMDQAEEFVNLVQAMRAAQKRYFRTRSYDDLDKCKKLESQVDRMLQNITHPDNQERLPL